MTKEFLDLIKEKIIQPKDGWNVTILSKYGFDFFQNNIIKNNIDIVLKILNDNLPYFYYCVPIYKIFSVTDINASLAKEWIAIDSEYILNIEKNSKSTARLDGMKFSKSIFNYSGFLSFRSNLIRTENYLDSVEKAIKKEQQKIKKNKNHSFTTPMRSINKKNNKGGIYGIFSINQKNDIKKPLYIGLTNRDFETRWNEHKKILYGQAPIPDGMHKLYNLLEEEFEKNTIIAEPIITFADLNTNRPLTQGEKEAMELAIITSIKPIGNTSGVDVPYYFTDGDTPSTFKT